MADLPPYVSGPAYCQRFTSILCNLRACGECVSKPSAISHVPYPPVWPEGSSLLDHNLPHQTLSIGTLLRKELLQTAVGSGRFQKVGHLHIPRHANVISSACIRLAQRVPLQVLQMFHPIATMTYLQIYLLKNNVYEKKNVNQKTTTSYKSQTFFLLWSFMFPSSLTGAKLLDG